MAFSTSGAVLRGDVNGVIIEAQKAESFLIGARVFPPLAVPVKSGQYPKFQLGAGELLNNDVTKRAPTGAYGRAVRKYTSDNYLCEDYGLEELVDDTYREDVARFFNAEVAAANMVRMQVMLGHEIRVAAEVYNTTNFGSAVNSTVAYTVANKATVDFPTDVTAAIDLLKGKGDVPNTIVMSSQVLSRLKNTTLLQNYVRGNRPTDATLQLTASSIAAAFADLGIQQVLIGNAVYNSAKKGQAFSSSAVWNNTYIWVGRVESGEMMSGGAGRTLYWSADSELFTSESYRDESRRSDVMRVRQNVDEKTIDGNSGTLIATQYS